MSTSGKQTSIESPLVTRLRQHANMTAIFRSVVPAKWATTTSLPPTGQIARAIVLPPHRATTIGSAVSGMKTAENVMPSVSPATAVVPPSTPPPIVNPAEAAPVSAIQQVSTEAAAQPDDKVERRLDTIMRRHREKAANDGNEVIPAKPPPPQPQATTLSPEETTPEAIPPVQQQG
jgi:hypothetical protein